MKVEPGCRNIGKRFFRTWNEIAFICGLARPKTGILWGPNRLIRPNFGFRQNEPTQRIGQSLNTNENIPVTAIAIGNIDNLASEFMNRIQTGVTTLSLRP
ncbi:MAG: hypothetical protein RIM33_12180 [Alphaproteobacteria bacterium]